MNDDMALEPQGVAPDYRPTRAELFRLVDESWERNREAMRRLAYL